VIGSRPITIPAHLPSSAVSDYVRQQHSVIDAIGQRQRGTVTLGRRRWSATSRDVWSTPLVSGGTRRSVGRLALDVQRVGRPCEVTLLPASDTFVDLRCLLGWYWLWNILEPARPRCNL